MTIEECYKRLNGNYLDVKKRLMNEKLINRFLLKFKDDPSIDVLREGYRNKDIETAFRGVHTLKGVAANLSFTQLYEVSSNLTEQLRTGSFPQDTSMLEEVERVYAQVIAVIQDYEKEK